jgi:hypothetical protein
VCVSLRTMRQRSTSLVILSLVACAVGLIALPAAAGEGAWQWLGEKRGVRLWKLQVPGQPLPGFRGQTVIEGSIDDIAQEIVDVKHHTEWMHRCVESWIYERHGDNRAVIYNRTSAAPWPIWDRDVVLDVELVYNQDRTGLTIRFQNLDDKLRPVPDRVVRMPRLVGFYKLTQLTPTRTRVIYQVEADIGGSIPDWIAHEVARDLPYYTLLSLRERVEDKPKNLPIAERVPVPASRPHLQASAQP